MAYRRKISQGRAMSLAHTNQQGMGISYSYVGCATTGERIAGSDENVFSPHVLAPQTLVRNARIGHARF